MTGLVAHAEWIDGLRREHVLEVANALGLTVQVRRGNASAGSFSCAACSAKLRHPSRGDRRGACGLVPGSLGGWRCYECDASGDQLHLIALALAGKRWGELQSDQKARVRAWVMEWLRIGESPSSTPDRPRLELPAADAAPEYPPVDEVRALWDRCVAVSRDARAVEWLRKRKLSARLLEQLGLCRVLPYGSPCPSWAGRPALEANDDQPARPAKPWSASLYRCLFGLYDAEGTMRSVLARYMGTPPDPRPEKRAALKSRAAYGFQRRGLVLADALGVRLLRGELAHGDAALSALRVVIGEGEMDLCTWSSDAFINRPKAGELRATIAVVAGSWTPELAARIPDGATVVIATHVDEGGERYAKAIEGTLAERIRSSAIVAKRWRP